MSEPMPTMRTLFERADPRRIPESALPRLPEWWPLPVRPTPDNPHPVPISPEQRTHMRAQHARELASEGPYDGTRGQIAWPAGGNPPATWSPINLPTCRYTLDRSSSTADRLVYRYDWHCQMHTDLIHAVEDAFMQADPTTAREARHDARDTDR